MTQSSDDSHAVFSTDPVAFDPAPALLGADTNGAAPQRVYGLHLTGEIYADGNEAVQSYWLRTPTDPALGRDKSEYLMYAGEPSRVETVLGAIATAAATPGYDKVLDGTFEGYANTAQFAFDEDANQDCMEGLRCRVTGTGNGGFSLRLEKEGKAVATLSAKLGPEGIDAVLKAAADLRSWATRHVEAIEKLPAAAPAA